MSLTLLRQVRLAAAMACWAATLVATPALAQSAPAYTISGSSFYAGDSPVTVGFTFTATQDVALTALGYHDHQQNGLANPHDIGLFSTSGTLLASATIAAGTGAPLIGEYRYVNLGSAFMLQSGTQYVLAAHTDGVDGYRYGGALTVSLDPRLTAPASPGRYLYGPNLAYPALSFFDFYATPNMLLAVPEPGAWAMMVVGLAVVGGMARRRRG